MIWYLANYDDKWRILVAEPRWECGGGGIRIWRDLCDESGPPRDGVFPKDLDGRKVGGDGGDDRAFLEQNGYGLFAVDELASGDFSGYVGLARPSWDAWFTPCVEIGGGCVPRRGGLGMLRRRRRMFKVWV